MKKLLLIFAAVPVMIACGGPAGNNTPANTANTNKATANTSASADPAAAEADIKKLMDTAQAALAKNDADAMEKIYADNYMLVNLDGSVQNKAERLAALRSGDAKYTSFSYSDATVRVMPGGDDAVVIAKLAMTGTMKGKPVQGDYRVTQVYSRTKDGWKQVSAQATKIESGAAKPDDKKAANSNANANAAKAPDKTASDSH